MLQNEFCRNFIDFLKFTLTYFFWHSTITIALWNAARGFILTFDQLYKICAIKRIFSSSFIRLCGKCSSSTTCSEKFCCRFYTKQSDENLVWTRVKVNVMKSEILQLLLTYCYEYKANLPVYLQCPGNRYEVEGVLTERKVCIN